MGWTNGPPTWQQLHDALSDRGADGRRQLGRPGRDGGDSPAWSNKRQPYEPPPDVAVPPDREAAAGTAGQAYAELHCHSNFSFLDGASHPEELVEEAVRLGLDALALTDHDGFYGVVRFAEAARAVGLPTVIGAELSLGLTRPQNGVADPEGHHLVVLARDAEGYARLARAISRAQRAGRGPDGNAGTVGTVGTGGRAAGTGGRAEKGKPVFALEDLAAAHGGHWLVLTGCRKGAVPAALLERGPQAAARELQRLVDAFGRDGVAVELWDHGDPLDSARNDALAVLAASAGTDLVATNNVHYATPDRRRLATALAAVRARRSLDEIDGWLPAGACAHLRSGAEQARRFGRWPGVVERAGALGLELAFDLALVAPNLPDYPVPEGETEMTHLRALTEAGATHRYGSRQAERVPGAWRQVDHELGVIEALGFPGYFLIVWDIVDFCRTHDIYCQGRGSAANSAVCYALGITNADAVKLGLLFERFLTAERDGPPDIDVDIESDRREEVIQYVYGRYGRDKAAQVANVITYRAKSAVRDMGKALGASQGVVDAWSKQVDAWGPLRATIEAQDQQRRLAPGAGREERSGDADIPAHVLDLAAQVEHFPRHLGIHSGGMVLCDRPVIEVCPVEWARMENRSVLQWDKDDCAAAGLVKFDLLGLGMLSVLHYGVDLIRQSTGQAVDIAFLAQEPEVYDMLCRADSVGVFQVESRAQMATLPRLQPRCFYDLVVEVALIRPGPIQGGSVHPYIRRHRGQEEVTYLHPLAEPALRKTLGVPLFQEQLMQLAIDVAGFTAGEADQLRQAMGSKRSTERMERLKARLYEGMAERGIEGEVADRFYEKLAAFANYGFPESHSVSFAYLVYASAWMKCHFPAAFCAALLNGQPMGFWSPQTIVADARRHGVEIRGVDINASAAAATLERSPSSAGGFAVRLGLREVRALGDDLAERIAAARPFASMEDVVRRVWRAPDPPGLAGRSSPATVARGRRFRGPPAGPGAISSTALEALATSGAFACFGLDRRAALWAAGAVAHAHPDRLEGVVLGASAPPGLPAMSEVEEAAADLWATGISPVASAVEFVRDRLDAQGVVTAARLAGPDLTHGQRVSVAGVVTHRQRPATAQGITFLNLEDETGLVNIVVSKGCWAAHRRVARNAAAMVVRGRLERVEGVVNIVAERLEPLDLRTLPGSKSRDFR